MAEADKTDNKADKASDKADKASDKAEADSKANKASEKADPPTYYRALENSLLNDWRILIRANKPTYLDDCTDLLRFLTKDNGLNVILITFDEKTPALMNILKEKGIDISKITVLDSLFISSGMENHYASGVKVHKPGSFSDLEVYSFMQLKKLNFMDSCVLFISLDKLGECENQNEIGCFLQVFGKQMEEFGIPMILMVHPVMDMTLLIVFTRYVDKIIPFRSTQVVKR